MAPINPTMQKSYQEPDMPVGPQVGSAPKLCYIIHLKFVRRFFLYYHFEGHAIFIFFSATGVVTATSLLYKLKPSWTTRKKVMGESVDVYYKKFRNVVLNLY